MNPSLTQKQENFCMAYIETGNASEAYRQAYEVSRMKPNSIHVKASELLVNGNVTVRVKQLQTEHKMRHDVTVDSLCNELEEARNAAMEVGQNGAAIQAVMGKAKLHGLGIEKRETKINTEMTKEEANIILRECGIEPNEVIS